MEIKEAPRHNRVVDVYLSRLRDRLLIGNPGRVIFREAEMKIPSEIKILIWALAIIFVFIAFLLVYPLFFQREHPQYVMACGVNLHVLYTAVELYGEKYGTLPSTIPSNEEWAQAFSEFLKFPDDRSRKGLLQCPTIDKRELTRISPWQSSYRMNPAVLGAKWKEIKDKKIPLLVEKRPNHDGKFYVLYTDGDRELTAKQPELRKKQEQPSQERER